MIDLQQTDRGWRLVYLPHDWNKPAQRAHQEQESYPGPICVLGIALWIGLIIGPAELLLTRIQKPLTDPSPGLFRMNRHILWTIPTVNLVVFGLCGLVVAVVLRACPRLGVRATVGPLVFLATLTLLLSCRWLHVLACLVIAFLLAAALAVRIEASFPAFRRLVMRTLPVMAVLVAAWIGWSLGGETLRAHHSASPRAAVIKASHDARSPNVLLVVLDTVRADHLSLHGYDRDTSPNLLKLAHRGITFKQARSTAPWTLPSHASMMTGRWPHELSTGINHPLDGTHPTLAEYLGARGYATAGFVGNAAYCGLESGLGRGFAHFEDHVMSPADILWTTALGQRILLQLMFRPERRTGGTPNDYHRKDAAQIRRDLFAWVKGQKGRPFFAFLNLYDAHDPYMPPNGFDRHFGVRPRSAADLAVLERWFIQDKKKLSPGEIQAVLDAYDDGIAYLDEELDRLIGGLDRLGLLAGTLVIVTADHGEHLGEHQLYGHASSLYDPEIHVPLLILLPDQAHAGEVVTEQVSLRDIAATIAGEVSPGASPFPGQSLARYWAGSLSPLPEPSLSEVDSPVMTAPNQGRSPVFRGPMKAVAFGKYVYIRNGDGKEELFDVEADPRQLRNLAELPQLQSILIQVRTHLERIMRLDAPAIARSRQN